MQTLKRTLFSFLGRFPSRLPDSPEAFNDFANDILNTYGIPNIESYHGAIANMIMHLSPSTHRKSKHFFACAAKKMMANEAAFAKLQELREAQKNAEAKKKAEEDAIHAVPCEPPSQEAVLN